MENHGGARTAGIVVRMGYTTDFVGWVQIDPPLNEHETDYLRAFNRTRRWDRSEGRFVVLPHPLADDEPKSDVDAYNRPAKGEPGLWCPWTVTRRRDCDRA